MDDLKTDIEYKVKVGDILIPNDEFYYTTGCNEFKVVEVKPYNMDVTGVIGQNPNNKYGVKIEGLVTRNDLTEYKYMRKMMTCDIKINPDIFINIKWGWYNEYCQGIFFTSQEEKDKWVKNYNDSMVEYHLNSARSYGYKK
jgi:hypothetical protein